MSNRSWKSGHGYLPTLTEKNYPIWKQKIRRVLIAKKAYNIVTGVKPLPPGNGVALCTLQEDWRDWANKAMALIHLRCCDKLLPRIDNIDDPMEMWEALRDRLDNASPKLGRTQVMQKFTASRPSQDKTVTQHYTKLIAFRKNLIGTTINITNDAMKTHIFIILSNWHETTIQILEQRIPTPTAQLYMDATSQYAKQTTQMKEIGDASTGVALYYCGGNHGRGHGRRGGWRAGGCGNGSQRLKCTYRKIDNHTTKACGKRKHAKGDSNTSRNDGWTCYHCSLTGHFKANSIHFKHARDQHNNVNKGTASPSLATAGDRDLIWIAESSTALSSASAPAAWVIDSGASHHMCKDRNKFNSIKKLRQPIVIELGDDNKVTVSHYGLVNILQEYEVNALYTPTFQLSLLSINQLDTAGYTSTFGRSKCSIASPSITITGNLVNDLYIISHATALTSTVSSVSTKCTSRRRKKKRKIASTIVHSTEPTTSLLHTASPSAASTVPQWPSATESPKPTRKPLTISQLWLWHRRLAHIHPTA